MNSINIIVEDVVSVISKLINTLGYEYVSDFFNLRNTLTDEVKTIKEKLLEITALMVECESVKIFDNIETFDGFSNFLSNSSLSIMKGKVMLPAIFNFSDLDTKKLIFEVFYELSEINSRIDDDLIKTNILQDYGNYIETKILERFENNVDTGDEKKKESQEFVIKKLTSFIKSLNPRKAIGVLNNNIQIKDVFTEAVMSQFDPDDENYDPENLQGIIDAFSKDKQIKKKIAPFIKSIKKNGGSNVKINQKLSGESVSNLLKNNPMYEKAKQSLLRSISLKYVHGIYDIILDKLSDDQCSELFKYLLQYYKGELVSYFAGNDINLNSPLFYAEYDEKKKLELSEIIEKRIATEREKAKDIIYEIETNKILSLETLAKYLNIVINNYKVQSEFVKKIAVKKTKKKSRR